MSSFRLCLVSGYRAQISHAQPFLCVSARRFCTREALSLWRARCPSGHVPAERFRSSQRRGRVGMALTPHSTVSGQRWYVTRTPTNETDDASIFEDELDAYETLLLNISESESEAAAVTAAPEALRSCAQPPRDAASFLTSSSPPASNVGVDVPTEALIADVLAALPLDGRAVRLTDVTRDVNAEAISAQFGSVRQFLQSFPSQFICTSEAVTATNPGASTRAQARWYVRRRRPHIKGPLTESLPPSSPSATAEREESAAVGDLQRLMAAYLEEELAQLASPSGWRTAPSPGVDRHAEWSMAAASSPRTEASKQVSCDPRDPPVWDETIPFEDDDMGELETMTTGAGVNDQTQLEAASREADGTTSTVSIVYHPTTSRGPARAPQPPMRRTPAQKPRTKRKQPRDTQTRVSVEDASLPSASHSETRAAPVRSPAELEALHTALAEQRGLRTPQHMLDYFVACVPTYFVRVSAVVASDALAKVLGPRNTMARVLAIYHYFFEFRDNGGAHHDQREPQPKRVGQGDEKDTASRRFVKMTPTVEVRLRADLAHPHRGAADSFYRARAMDADAGGESDASPATRSVNGVPRLSRLQRSAITSSFASLQSTIPSSHTTKTKSASTNHRMDPPRMPHSAHTQVSATTAAGPSARAAPLRPGENLFLRAERGDSRAQQLVSLCLSVPWSHVITATEAARLSGLDAPRLVALALEDEYSLHHGLFLSDRTAMAEATSEHAAGDEATIDYSSVRLRVRPFFLSPSATDDLDAAALPEAVRRQLRPSWSPLSRFLTKLPETALSALQAQARAAQELPSSPSTSTTGQRATPFRKEAAYLMGFGRLCWLQQRSSTSPSHGAPSLAQPAPGGLFSIRAFTADAALDDMGAHLLTMLLHGYAHATLWQPLQEVLATAERALTSLAPSSDVSQAWWRAVRAVDLAQLTTFLKKQRLLLEVEVRPCSDAGEAGGKQLWLRRRTSFASFHNMS